MSWWEAIFLGVLQGVTEFLPISSSGHLVLFQKMFGWDNPDNAQEWFFDGVLHFGTLIAVLIYFGKELRHSLQTIMRSNGRVASEAVTWPANYRDVFYLFVLVGIASIPAAVSVLFRSDDIKQSFKRPDVVALNFILLGAVLIMTGYLKPGKITGSQMRWYHALAMGIAQGCSAVMRGLSRSGSTLAIALLVGLEKSWAVRFSFMMSVVASLGLGASGIWKAMKDPSLHDWLTGDFLFKTVIATIVSAVVAYLTITPLIALVKQAKLWVFGAYVWLVAAVYFGWVWLS